MAAFFLHPCHSKSANKTNSVGSGALTPQDPEVVFPQSTQFVETAQAPFHTSLSRIPNTLNQLASFRKAGGKIKGNFLNSMRFLFGKMVAMIIYLKPLLLSVIKSVSHVFIPGIFLPSTSVCPVSFH